MPVFAVDAADLLQVVAVSLLAGVGITALFSCVILAGSRLDAARRAGESRRATLYGALAGLLLLLFAGSVVFGVQVILAK